MRKIKLNSYLENQKAIVQFLSDGSKVLLSQIKIFCRRQRQRSRKRRRRKSKERLEVNRRFSRQRLRGRFSFIDLLDPDRASSDPLQTVDSVRCLLERSSITIVFGWKITELFLPGITGGTQEFLTVQSANDV